MSLCWQSDAGRIKRLTSDYTDLDIIRLVMLSSKIHDFMLHYIYRKYPKKLFTSKTCNIVFRIPVSISTSEVTMKILITTIYGGRPICHLPIPRKGVRAWS